MFKPISSNILSRVRAAILLAATAVLLTACFVTAENPVDGTGPDGDPQLVGAWRGLDEDGKPEKGLYMHVTKTKSGEGLTLILVESDGYMAFDVRTVQVGKRRFMNANLKPIQDLKEPSDSDKLMIGTHIVLYEVKGDRMFFWLMDEKEVADAVQAGKVKGQVEGSGMSKSVRLTATPEELNAFLSKGNVESYFQKKPAQLRRLRD